ncbi:MAG TPA: hypothetical protein VHM65_04225 [Candidatus Lustribacter sp.]|nr:hypothetical protein [Candidatus Lustribacter sp.]
MTERPDGLEDPMTTTPPAPSALPPEDERRLAVALFNGVWALMDQEGRSARDEDRMVHMAHASRYHWEQVGPAAHLARGEWLCSRVYAVLRRAEPCLHHAQRALDICADEGIGDWDLAFAYEALARGHAVAGDGEKARTLTGLCSWPTWRRSRGSDASGEPGCRTPRTRLRPSPPRGRGPARRSCASSGRCRGCRTG